MNIRKEQVLFLLTLLLVGYFAYSFSLNDTPRTRRPGAKDYESVSGRSTLLADASKAVKEPKEIFLEPKETRPLEPRGDLPFPQMRPLPVVMLPFPIGQHAGALSGLRRVIPTSKPGDAEKGNPQDGNQQNGNGAPGNAVGAGQGDLADRYDQLVKVGQERQIYYGLILVKNEEQKFKWGLAGRVAPEDEVRFQWVDRQGKWKQEFNLKGEEIVSVKLARTLRNEVGMRSVALVPAPHNATPKQRDFILWLIEKGRLEDWVFDKALERAKTYQKFATPKEEGLLYEAKVLRAKGDLDAEWKLFKNLDKSLQGSSFQLCGLGQVEARLGLDKVAEEHLREAVRINDPIDPRNFAALAQFLLNRGRAAEAAPFAEKAFSYRTRRDPTKDEQVGFLRLHFRAQLAVGDLEGAAATLTGNATMFSGERLGVESDYLGACLAYAKQDYAAAKTGFQNAYNSGFVPDALVGLAASKFATGDAKGAMADFDKAADENPRVRHLALAGKGLVLSHTEGKGADALEQIDAALVANPIDPYILYLKGRQLRLNQDRDGAIGALKQALKQQDGFIEALAELTEAYFTEYESKGEAGALLSAIRYVDRLVELDQKQGTKESLFLEKQGRIHYAAADYRGARRAFELGAESGSVNCEVGLALIDYVQKRSDRAEDRLNRKLRNFKKDDPMQVHIVSLLDSMLDHASKEQVIANFNTKLGRVWKTQMSGGAGFKSNGQGILQVKTKRVRRKGEISAHRVLAGPGRFEELTMDLRVNSDVEFAGIYLSTPSRGANPPSFRVDLGCNDEGFFEFRIRDSGGPNKNAEPIRTKIKVQRGRWYSLRFYARRVSKNKKTANLHVLASVDGQVVFDDRVRALRRGTGSGDFQTGAIVFPKAGAVDVEYRRFRRVQYK